VIVLYGTIIGQLDKVVKTPEGYLN